MRRPLALLLAGGLTAGLLGLSAPAAQAAPKNFTHPVSPVSIPASETGWGMHSLSVSGLTGNITDVDVLFKKISADNIADLDAFLVSPSGQKVWLFSDICGGGWMEDVPWTIDDDAPSTKPASMNMTTCTAEAFKPSNHDGGDNANEPSDATTTLSSFNGTDPNGIWELWIRDDSPATAPVAKAKNFTVRITTDAPDTRVTKVNTKKKRRAVIQLKANQPKTTFEYTLKAKRGSVKKWTALKGKKFVAKNLRNGKTTVRIRAVTAGTVDSTPVTVVLTVKKNGKVKAKVTGNDKF
jgi:subtilisin-like proprotein convertase family protein